MKQGNYFLQVNLGKFCLYSPVFAHCLWTAPTPSFCDQLPPPTSFAQLSPPSLCGQLIPPFSVVSSSLFLRSALTPTFLWLAFCFNSVSYHNMLGSALKNKRHKNQCLMISLIFGIYKVKFIEVGWWLPRIGGVRKLGEIFLISRKFPLDRKNKCSYPLYNMVTRL